MKSSSQQEVHRTTDQYEMTAEFLEDLAAYADSDQERQSCLATARNFRLAARSKSASPKQSKGLPKPSPRKHQLSPGGQHG